MSLAHAVPVALAVSLLVAAPARAFDPDEDRVARVFVESGTGVIGGAFGGFIGGLTGLGLCELGDGGGRGWGCLGPALIGAVTGGWWGIAGGVVLGGEAMGANGGFGWELLGQTGGTALAAGLYGLLNEAIDSEAFWVTTWIVLPMAGGILAYELSTDNDELGARADALVVPFVLSF